MNVSYKGIRKELPAKLQSKLDSKFQKLSKLLEQRGPKEAHVVVTSERHLLKAEIAMQVYGHALVGISSDADLFTALWGAVDKLEKQAAKERTKWREKSRRSKPGAAKSTADGKAPVKASGSRKTKSSPLADLAGVVVGSDGRGAVAQRIFRVNNHRDQKPMTLDEALLEMEKDQDYLVYRDSERDKVSMLVRRRDGHFDLIES
jgi:putative sigma-54 modulation protein